MWEQHPGKVVGPNHPSMPLGQEEAGAEGFKYLLSMKMWSLTENKVQARTRRGDGVPGGSSGGA